jgi:hypothetical protein
MRKLMLTPIRDRGIADVNFETIHNKNHNFAKAGSLLTELGEKKFVRPVALLSTMNSFSSLSGLLFKARVQTVVRT